MKDSRPYNKPTYSKRKFLIAFLIAMGSFAAVRHIFNIPTPINENAPSPTQAIAFINSETEGSDTSNDTLDDEVVYDDETIDDSTLLMLDADEAYGNVTDEVRFDSSRHETTVNSPEDNLAIEHPITDSAQTQQTTVRHNPAMWSYHECFPDLQDVQLETAIKHGIKPVDTRKEAQHLVDTHALVNISRSPYYHLDSLTHSMPYLVPRAQHLLNTICINFIDSCQSKGIPLHLPIVTSVLRTTSDIARLQRTNKNATTNSCHCYGTTVDIAYNKFYPVTSTYTANQPLTRWDEQMKRVLAEVLFDLRSKGLCYVKYEYKQACFHLTCR